MIWYRAKKFLTEGREECEDSGVRSSKVARASNWECNSLVLGYRGLIVAYILYNRSIAKPYRIRSLAFNLGDYENNGHIAHNDIFLYSPKRNSPCLLLARTVILFSCISSSQAVVIWKRSPHLDVTPWKPLCFAIFRRPRCGSNAQPQNSKSVALSML